MKSEKVQIWIEFVQKHDFQESVKVQIAPTTSYDMRHSIFVFNIHHAFFG